MTGLVVIISNGHKFGPRGGPMEETISVTDFKVRCLDLFKRVGQRQLERITITHHGKVVAVIMPPPVPQHSIRDLHGFMMDRTIVADDLDLTAPTLSKNDLGAGWAG